MNHNFYVYGLYDPITNIPFYIGKGKGDRIKAHLTESKLPREKQINKLKCAKINKIINSGHTLVIKKLHEHLMEQEAFDYEILLIKQFGRIIDGTGPLTNLTEGGDSGAGHPEPIKYYSRDGTFIGSFSSLQEASEIIGIHKSTICAALNKRTRLAGGYRWAYEDEKIRELETNRNVSPVIQYTLEGRKIKHFDSIKEAAKAVAVPFTSIVDACQGNHFSSGGFRWSYNGQTLTNNKTDLYRYKKKQYQALNNNGDIMGTFDTIKEAITNLPTANSTGIIDCCRGRKKSSGGYKWSAIFKD